MKLMKLTVFLALLAATRVLGQDLAVKTGQNEMDNESWVRLELKANHPYVSSSGKEVVPLLEIQCSVAPRAAKVHVFFYTGIVETESPVRVKLGDEKPLFLLYSSMPDRQTLHYIDLQDGIRGPLADLNAAKMTLALAGYKTVLIEFRPYLSPS